MRLPIFDPRNTELMLTLLIALFALAAESFIFFHITAEGITIVISAIIYIDYRILNKNINNSFRLLLGNAFLFVAVFDIAHLLTYYGMDITLIKDADTPTQLWVAGRYILSFSFLSAVLLLNRRCSSLLIHAACALVTTLMLLSILYLKIFPVCFREEGLTSFKIFSEYLFCLIYMLTIVFLRRVKKYLNPHSYNGTITFLILSIFSELCFSIYIELYGPINVLGHVLKVSAFIFIYYSLVLNDPVITPAQPPDVRFGNTTPNLPSHLEKMHESHILYRKRLTDWYSQRIDKLKKKDPSD